MTRDMLTLLESIPVSTLVDNIKPLITNGMAYPEAVTADFISLLDVLNEMQKLAFSNTNYPSENVSQTYTYPSASGDKIGAFSDIWLYFNDSTIFPNPPFTLLSLFTITDTGDTGTFQGFNNCLDLLKMICGNFFAYHLFEYDVATDKFQLQFKQRDSGTLVTPVGILKRSTRKDFFGY